MPAGPGTRVLPVAPSDQEAETATDFDNSMPFSFPFSCSCSCRTRFLLLRCVFRPGGEIRALAFRPVSVAQLGACQRALGLSRSWGCSGPDLSCRAASHAAASRDRRKLRGGAQGRLEVCGKASGEYLSPGIDDRAQSWNYSCESRVSHKADHFTVRRCMERSFLQIQIGE
jgi:hypothetical protein